MPTKPFIDEQIAFASTLAEAGTKVGEIYRQMGIAEATFYRWTKVCAGMGVSEIRRPKELEEENGKLKRLVAEVAPDKSMVSRWSERNWRTWALRIDEAPFSRMRACAA